MLHAFLRKLSGVIDAGKARLAAQVSGLERIAPAVFDKVGAALAKFEADVFADALRTQIEDPVVVEGSGVPVGLSADDHQLHAVQIRLQIHTLQKRLGGDAPVPDRERTENRKFPVCWFSMVQQTVTFS